MKLIIALTATAFLLGGCLEPSESQPNNELEVDKTEIPVVPPVVTESPVVPSAVANMLINTQNPSGEFQNYWDCAVVGDDAPFLVALTDNGGGLYQASDGVVAMTWSESINGTLSVELTESGELVEWTNFEFIGLFEFTADLYQGGQLVETDRCVLTEVSGDVGVSADMGTTVSESYFVTAQSPDSADAAERIWDCELGGESIYFFLYADKTGVFGYTDENADGELEISVLFLDDWNFANGSLETFTTSAAGSLVRLVGMEAISTIDASSFTAANIVISDENFENALCLKF